MNPRVRVLDLEDLDDLPSPCRGCMFWQSASAHRGGHPGDPAAQDAWWRAVQLEWGSPGRGVWVDGVLVAYALFAPAVHLQRVRTLGPPASDDAVVLATMWVDQEHRGGGIARHLMQVVAREALHHHHTALEAYGGTPLDGLLPGLGSCLVDAEFLPHLGFTLHRPHPRHPLYRIDLTKTARWPSAVGHALGEVIASLSGRERVRSRPALEGNRSLPGGAAG